MAIKIHIGSSDEPKRPVESNRTLHAWLGVTREAHQSPTWDDARAELKAFLAGHKSNELFYGRKTYERMNNVYWRRQIDRLKADLKRGIE